MLLLLFHKYYIFRTYLHDRFSFLSRNKKNTKIAQSYKELSVCWKFIPLNQRQLCQDVEFLVVDTETSSLDVNTGELLSIGWVAIKNKKIILDSAKHVLLKNNLTVGQSAVIHTLRDCELENGVDAEEMMPEFLKAAQGRVLVFHYAQLDMDFLNKVSRRLYGAPLLVPFVDTLRVEKKVLVRENAVIEGGALTLANCRRRYNLPDYPVHNALMDAFATAELLLAQIAYKGTSVQLSQLQ